MRKTVEWIVGHPWTVMGIIAVITVGLIAAIPQLTMLTDFTEYLSKKDPAVAALELAEDRYGSQTFFMVAIETDDTIFKTSTLEKIEDLTEEFEGIIGVDEVSGPLNAQVITATKETVVVGPAAPEQKAPQTLGEIERYESRALGSRMLRDYIVSSDGHAAAISIELKEDADDVEVAQQVVEIVRKYRGPEAIHVAGLPYMNLVLTESMGQDLQIMLPLVILMIAVVLLLSFRSLRGVLLPLLVVSLSTVWAVGTMALIHVPFTIISFVLPVILMAIGIAYCIHVLNKYYEELAKGRPRREAVIETAMTMISPVSMAGLTTMAGFLSLISSFLIPQRQFGIFTALGVFVAMALSLALIPALLAILPSPRGKRHKRQGLLSMTLAGLGWLVARHRKAVLIASAGIFIAFIIGTSLVRVETSEREFLGEDHPIVQATNLMDAHFSGSEQLSIEIDTAKRDGLKDPALLRRIVALEEWLQTKAGVKINKTSSLADLVREMNQKFHADDPSYYVIPETRELVAQLLLLFTFQGGDLGNMALGNFSAGEISGFYSAVGSSELVQLAGQVQTYLEENFPDVRAEMVGATRVGASMFSRIVTSQLVSLLTSILAAGLIVTLLIGSFVAGLVSLIPLVLTVVINFGVMGFSNTPLDMATLMVSSIAIGIGIDYAIHFLTRFRREYRQSRDLEKALDETMQTTGRGISFNALALAFGFAVLLFSAFKGTFNFGLLIAMTMVISAASAFTVIPAILITWEPKFLRRKAWSRMEVPPESGLDSKGQLALNPDPSEVEDEGNQL